jgi:small subunit ribosomal protein S4
MALLKSKEKKERALGMSLGLKAHRCNSPKCAMVKRPYKPGPHGKARQKAPSEFGQQLLEKQKIMVSYGLRENQLRKIFEESSKKKESGTASAINLLERRLDNVIFRMGFAPSRIMARQYVSHGHFKVNGRKVTIPSYRVKVNDVIMVKPESSSLLIFKNVLESIKQYQEPTWISINKEKLEGKIKSLPHDIEIPFDINLVVDYYSR